MASKRLEFEQLLLHGFKQLRLPLSAQVCSQLFDYIALLQKWNKAYNLTAIDTTKEIIIRHIFDSLSITNFVRGPFVLDVGSGAGLPGLILALVKPEINFVLLDSNHKKTLFLHHVALMLKIPNIIVATSRVEKFHFQTCFATIVTRATMGISAIIEHTKHLVCKDGQWLLMQGKCAKEELVDLGKSFEVHKLIVPELAEERHLVVINAN